MNCQNAACGAEFTPKRKNSRCCSVKCYRAWFYSPSRPEYAVRLQYLRDYRKSDKGRESHTKYLANKMTRPDRRLGLLVSGALGRAKTKGMPYDEDLLQHLLTLNAEACACCGAAFDYSFGRGRGDRDKSISIDKVVPGLGYIKGNVRLICMYCNGAKSYATEEDLVRLLAYVRKFGSPVLAAT